MVCEVIFLGCLKSQARCNVMSFWNSVHSIQWHFNLPCLRWQHGRLYSSLPAIMQEVQKNGILYVRWFVNYLIHFCKRACCQVSGVLVHHYM